MLSYNVYCQGSSSVVLSTRSMRAHCLCYAIIFFRCSIHSSLFLGAALSFVVHLMLHLSPNYASILDPFSLSDVRDLWGFHNSACIRCSLPTLTRFHSFATLRASKQGVQQRNSGDRTSSNRNDGDCRRDS